MLKDAATLSSTATKMLLILSTSHCSDQPEIGRVSHINVQRGRDLFEIHKSAGFKCQLKSK